jgi:hypothetical protein
VSDFAKKEIARILKNEPPGIKHIGRVIGAYLDELGRPPRPIAMIASTPAGTDAIGRKLEPGFYQSIDGFILVTDDVCVRIIPIPLAIQQYEEDGHQLVVENLKIIEQQKADVALVLLSPNDDGRYVVAGLSQDWSHAS